MSTHKMDDLFDRLQKGKDRGYIGEAISQLEHGLQAAYCAQLSGADDACIIAALFHDIGHLVGVESMGGFGVATHETIGAAALRGAGFSEKVCALVGGHVDAKRYLTWKDPQYLKKLSPASLETLKYQGGPMTDTQAHTFEQHPYFKEILQIRAWDEAAKRVDWDVPALSTYRERAECC